MILLLDLIDIGPLWYETNIKLTKNGKKSERCHKICLYPSEKYVQCNYHRSKVKLQMLNKMKGGNHKWEQQTALVAMVAHILASWHQKAKPINHNILLRVYCARLPSCEFWLGHGGRSAFVMKITLSVHLTRILEGVLESLCCHSTFGNAGVYFLCRNERVHSPISGK